MNTKDKSNLTIAEAYQDLGEKVKEFLKELFKPLLKYMFDK